MAADWSSSHPLRASGEALVVKPHAIELAKKKGNLAEIERLQSLRSNYVPGNQRELGEAGIFTETSVEHAQTGVAADRRHARA